MNRIYTLLFLFIVIIVMTAGTIDLEMLPNYENQDVPGYINRDNTSSGNSISDEEATLGRILFYDKQLSVNDEISCGSCHKQEFAFGDTEVQSIGVNGLTGRHSTRLVNARFGEEENFFWDERAASLEIQTTMPIQDHIEMGFSGANGDPDIDSLISKLEGIDYYQNLFSYIYGDASITEVKIQNALAQFVRSIQSFDSKYDIGREQVNNNNADFPNFTDSENAGKDLFMSNPNNGGAGCNSCHRAPEFDIDPDSDNNGIISVAGNPAGVDVTNTRSPTLRDMVNPDGILNGPFMHDGSLETLLDVINHYDDIPNNGANTNLDNRLNGGGGNLNLSDQEKEDLENFLLTLTGSDVYTNPKWSDPFDANGNIVILNGAVLPIEYATFNVELENSKVLLTWETVAEIDNEGWDIERSTNAIDWSSLDFVEGVGQSSSLQSYRYTDESPWQGVNYYRLRQYDFDGHYSYSNTLVAEVAEVDIDLNIYPNPASDFIQLDSKFESLNVEIINQQGGLIQKIYYNKGEQIDISHLLEGVYYIYIKIANSDQIEIRRFVKL